MQLVSTPIVLIRNHLLLCIDDSRIGTNQPALGINKHSPQIFLVFQNLLAFYSNMWFYVTWSRPIIVERALRILKVYGHQNFLLISQCTVVGQLHIHVQNICPAQEKRKGVSLSLRATLRSVCRTHGRLSGQSTVEAWIRRILTILQFEKQKFRYKIAFR